MQTKIIPIPIFVQDDDWFLSQSTTTAGTATTFSNDGGSVNGYPQRIALEQNNTSAMSVTVVYRRPENPEDDYSETISVPAGGTTAYTTYAAAKLISVTWPSVSGKTLKVGFQTYPYFYVGDCSHDQIVGATLQPTYIASAGHTGVPVPVTKATTGGTPAANKIGYDSTSKCIHYCYPVDGSSNEIGGILWVTLRGM